MDYYITLYEYIIISELLLIRDNSVGVSDMYEIHQL